MKLTTLKLGLICAGLVIVANGENIRASINAGETSKAQKSAFNDRVKQNKLEERQAIELSKVALGRAKSCIRIVDAVKRVDSYLTEGQKVIDTALNRPVRAAATVCSGLGDTGITNQNGEITDLARVVDADMAEYKALLKIK
jgi:hypothetical protein